MRLGGYYSTQVLPGLKLISFNTNYWQALAMTSSPFVSDRLFDVLYIVVAFCRYSFNFYTTLMEDGEEIQEMQDFMRAEFELARQNNEQVTYGFITRSLLEDV